MQQMNMRQWINEQINAKRKNALPVLSFPAIQLLHITVEELISDSELQASAMVAIAEKFDMAASVSLMDLSVEAEAFGAPIRISPDEVPTVSGRIITSPADVLKLKTPKIGAGRTEKCIKAISLAKERITDRPVFAGVIGPFSLAGRLMDMTEIMINCYEEPEMVSETMAICTAFLTDYILALQAAGADGVIMAEPASGLLSPTLHRSFSYPYVRQIIDAVSSDTFQVIYHNCGNTQPIIDDIFTLGAGGYHLGNAVDLSEILKHPVPSALVMGNVDPVGQFRHGTPEGIITNTTTLLNQLHSYQNFIISSGCDIPPISPMENIEAFFTAVSRFYCETETH